MNLKLTRRQFSQLAAVSTAAAAVGVFATRTFAQTPTVILGVRPGSITSSDDSDTPEIDKTDDTDEITGTSQEDVSTLRPIVVESLTVGGSLLNLANVEVQTQLTTPPILKPNDQLSGLASLRDGRLVLATTSFSTSRRAIEPTRLIILGESPKILTLSGLKRQETLVNLLTLKDGSLGGLLARRFTTLSFAIAIINPDTGEITDQNRLPRPLRVTTVTECPDGNLYGISVTTRGETRLELIDDPRNDRTTPLQFNDQPWISGFSDLVCSPSNQLFALGAGRYESPYYVHTIDKNTGVITRIRGFNVAKIAVQLG